MKNYIIIILTLLAFCLNVGAQEKIKGRVIDAQSQEPLAGATIKVLQPVQTVMSNTEGYFQLTLAKGNYQLSVQYLGYVIKEEMLTIPLTATLLINLTSKENTLQEVNVVSTGYQTLPKERATGSFVVVDSAVLNKRTGSNILDRLKGAASGVIFDPSTGTSSGLSVRGRSTIFANTDPLIVLDNFPFDGDINAINPDDIASISILKDAAAASIWGVRASNGVIVLTSKKGRLDQPLSLLFNANAGVTQRPDLFSTPEIGTAEYIALEEELYKKGAYVNALAVPRTYVSPVVAILNDRDKGKISEQAALQLLEQLRNGGDVRSDIGKYYYRESLLQQYTLSLKGGGKSHRFYTSVAYKDQAEELVSNHNNRISLNSQHSYFLLGNKLEISSGINLSISNFSAHNGNILSPSFIKPYTKLVDAQGNALAVPTYKQQWLDTVGGGRLLNWDWIPLQELDRGGSKRNLTNYVLDAGVKYKLNAALNFSVNYQYSKGANLTDNLFELESYFTRDYINQFSQPNYLTNEVIRPAPLGDILKKNLIGYDSHNLRAQAGFDKSWGRHQLTAILGAEVKDYSYEANSYSLYGYDQALGQVGAVDFNNQYRNFVTGTNSYIAGNATQNGISDRYLSYFGNLLYNLRNKYSFSVSARRDESNLFGVKANQKGVPLWSVGAAWVISRESFFQKNWINELKMRVTYGYNGNVDKTVSAYVTAQTSGSRNRFGNPYATLVNPPNPNLSWERIGVLNLALDFALFKNILNGSIEYYHKNGQDIIGNSPLPPSSGVSTFRGNSADIVANGVDLVLNSRNISSGRFQWGTNLIYSYSKDKIKTYKATTAPLGFREGFPFNGVFSYRWAGLDPKNGNPLGYVNGKLSSDWATITSMDSLGRNYEYSGSGAPLVFGSLRNNFSFLNFELSFNLVFKLNYFFRAPSVNYTNLYNLSATHIDYQQRWLKPGDELYTNVPSASYPANNARDMFYANSQVLIARADHLRLQDIQLSYGVPSKSGLLKNSRIYANCSNVGLLWAANDKGLDPEYLNLAGQISVVVGFNKQF